jgi:hypothetical protein
MLAGQKEFVRPGHTASTGAGPRIGAGAAMGRGMSGHGYLFDALPMPPYDPTRAVSREGAGMLFGKPDFTHGLNIPGGADVSQFNQPWHRGGGPHGGLGWEIGAPGTVGGLTAASAALAPYYEGEVPWWVRESTSAGP